MVPIIDRELSPNGLGKVRKHSSWIPVLAVILVAVFMVGAIAGIIGLRGDSKEPLPSETPMRIPAGITYTSHSPIYINGNGGFTNASGVVWGSGTASDPYIIADWDINASTATGINIEGTDAHFILRNCYVHDGSSIHNAIELHNSINGVLENDTCFNCYAGIWLDTSSNNTLINNDLSNNTYSIEVDASSHNTLTNNNCSSNEWIGIYFASSSYNTLDNNQCSNNLGMGIQLWNSDSNILTNNNCSGNDYGMYIETGNDHNTLTNNICNSNNYDGIFIHMSSDSTLINNTCNSNNERGMYIHQSNDNNVLINSCSDNSEGIWLDSVRNNTLGNNTCSSNTVAGMILDYTNNDTLSGNVMTHNGIEIYENYLSTGNTHNIDTSNTVNGRPVCYYSNESGTTVPGGAGQVILAGCTDFIIEGQNLSNASLGIEVLYSSEIMINNNECSNDFYGILLLSSNSCVVSNTTCSNNTEGIVLSSSNNNTLRNNDCSYNFDGIQLVFSSNNIISDNNCSSNDEYGIALSFWNSANTISRNQVCSNTGYGVYIDSGLNNRIWNNTFVGNNGATGAYSSMHIQCLDYGTNNWWNSTAGYGNYWNDWITPDANHDGIVDLPYDIAGSAGAKDYYPQTTTQTQIPEFGMMSLVVIGLMSVIVVAGEAKRKKKSCS